MVGEIADRQRSIPAWAGEPRGPKTRPACSRVYPRVGGGAGRYGKKYGSSSGLSPRGRGSHDFRPCLRLHSRSIPAWAGEPMARSSASAGLGVYPRVGGGAQPKPEPFQYDYGLSPRGRGSPHRDCRQSMIDRSIPAWAGEPISQQGQAYMLEVYPRVGGGAGRAVTPRHFLGGLSPRGRGSPLSIIEDEVVAGSIPAGAGEPTSGTIGGRARKVYPRVGGGAILIGITIRGNQGLSPRGRGSRFSALLRAIIMGSIPAWAGEPAAARGPRGR